MRSSRSWMNTPWPTCSRETEERVWPVLCHELDHLQGAFRTIDVGDFNICLEWIRWTSRVCEQSIREHWNDRRILDHGRNRLWPPGTFPRRDDGILGEFR